MAIEDESSAPTEKANLEPDRQKEPQLIAQPPWLGLAQYHSNETLAMLQRYDQIQNLICPGHHRPSEGTFCEDLLRAFLRETLPKRFGVDTGFILGTKTSVPWRTGKKPEWHQKEVTASPQIDVIVHDIIEYSPVLRSGEFVIVLPDAVRAAIEVKKTLTSGSLERALQNLAVTRDFLWKSRCPISHRFFTGLFTFDADEDLCPKDGKLSDTYKNRVEEICAGFPPGIAIPDLVISAPHLILMPALDGPSVPPCTLSWWPAKHSKVNISGQVLLYYLMKKLEVLEMGARVQRFQVPSDWAKGGCIQYKVPEAFQGFDLRLMSSLNDVSGIPTEGKSLIIVAAVNNLLSAHLPLISPNSA